MTGSSYLCRTQGNRARGRSPHGGRRRPAVGLRSTLAALAIALPPQAGFASSPPQAVFVEFPEETDTVGHHTLAWGLASSGDDDRDDDPGHGDVIYEVRRAVGPDFVDEIVVHEGPGDRAFFSGIPDGTHRHRVRARLAGDAADAVWGPWSPPVEIVVARQSLAFAWTLFAIGAVLFAAIAGFIVRNAGSRTA